MTLHNMMLVLIIVLELRIRAFYQAQAQTQTQYPIPDNRTLSKVYVNAVEGISQSAIQGGSDDP